MSMNSEQQKQPEINNGHEMSTLILGPKCLTGVPGPREEIGNASLCLLEAPDGLNVREVEIKMKCAWMGSKHLHLFPPAG